MDYTELKERILFCKNTPLPGYNLLNLLKILANEHFKVDIKYLPRLIYSMSISGIISPFRFFEKLKYDKYILKTEIKHEPLFIIGLWRSGTTHLHNLITQDRNFAFFSTFQAYMPGVFLNGEKLFKPLVDNSIPKKRPMDDVVMQSDFPQEDQYALGAFSKFSYYHGWCFPKNMDYYNRFVLMEKISRKTIEEFNHTYIYLIKKITYYNKGKRIVLKNQDNTGRIKIINDLFPKSKFIFIIRNPYHLYLSMLRFMSIAIPRYCIQTPPVFEKIEKIMLSTYKKIMKNYLIQKKLIFDDNLIEIKYENLVAKPINELSKIYKNLKIEGFNESKYDFISYLSSIKDYKRFEYCIPDDIKERVQKHWGFIFEEFDYDY